MLETELKNIIQPALDELGVDLVDLQVHGKGGRTIIRIFIDEPGGIRIDRCTRMSRMLSDLLDSRNIMQSGYTLEVSSPGTDRPLVTERDFQRHTGRSIKLLYRCAEESCEMNGEIVKVEDDVLYLTHNDELIGIPFDTIISGTIIIKFK